VGIADRPGRPYYADERRQDAPGVQAEHVVDVETDLVLAATVHPGDVSDHVTLVDSVMQADLNLQAAGARGSTSPRWRRTRATTRAPHWSCATRLDVRTYSSRAENKGCRRWTDKSKEERAAVLANRRRMKGARGKRLGRLRSEFIEAEFSHTSARPAGRDAVGSTVW